MLDSNMNSRQKQLLDKLKNTGELSIEEEAANFSVSAMTIRRDFQYFEDCGLAIRTHGGAVSKENSAESFFLNDKPSANQKKIGAAALQILEPGNTVMIGVGTTTLQLARHLAGSNIDISVLTNSLPVAAALFRTRYNVLLTGGLLRARSLDLTGPVAEKNLSEFYIDMLITGCDGAVSTEGFFTSDLNMATMERKSVEISGKVVVLAESRKFEKRSFVKFADLSDVSTLISDKGLAEDDRKKLEDAGIEVITV